MEDKPACKAVAVSTTGLPVGIYTEKKLLQQAGFRLKSGMTLSTTLRLTQRLQFGQKILNTSHGVTRIDGVTLDNRTRILESLIGASRSHRLQPILLTQMRRGQSNLQADVPIASHSVGHVIKHLLGQTHHDTITRFLADSEKGLSHYLLNHKNVVIVDQAHRLNTTQLDQLTARAGQRQARLILLGSHQSSGGVVHRAYDLLAEGGVRTLDATKQYPPNEQTVHNIHTLFRDKIGERMIEVDTPDEQYQRIADHYVALDATQRRQTVVLAPSKAIAEVMNTVIAHTRQQQHAEKGDVKLLWVNSLQPIFMTKDEVSNAANYCVGSLLRINQDYLRARLSRGQYYRITRIEGSALYLQTDKGHIRRIQPQQFVSRGRAQVECFTEVTQQIGVGEKLEVTRTDHSNQLIKGDYLTVSDIKDQRLILESATGKRIKLDARQPAQRHIRYGYVSSMHGDDATRRARHVIALMPAHSRLSDQKRWFDLMHRATSNTIYTDDATRLLTGIAERTGERPSALKTYLQAEQQHTPADQAAYAAMIQSLVARELTHIPTPQAATPDSIAKEAVDYAISHLSEREAAFEHTEVLRVALQSALGHVRPADIEEKVRAAQAEGLLIPGVMHYEGKWTTQVALARERQVIFGFLKDQNTLSPLIEPEKLNRLLADHPPYDSHRGVLTSWLSSQSRMLLLDGYAGVGKSTLLVHANDLLKKSGYELLTLAPTHVAVKGLREKGLNAMTVAKFIATERREKEAGRATPQPHRVIVLDEHSLNSTTQGLAFIDIVHHRQVRSLAMGDQRQLSPVAAGDDHRLLQALGLSTIKLTAIHRQQPQWYKSLVQSAYATDYQSVMDQLGERVVETTDIAKATAAHYTKFPEAIQKALLIMTPGNALRKQINSEIRQQLSQRKQLVGQTYTFPQLTALNRTETEMTRAVNYKVKLDFGQIKISHHC